MSAAMSQDMETVVRSLKRNNFNPAYLHRIHEEHQRGRRDHGMTLWALMVLEMWYRAYIDRVVNHAALGAS